MFLTLTGCSDLFGKKVVEKPMNSERFRANCTLDMDAISLILEENISEQLNCLGKNLDIFMDVAELGRGGKLSRVSLMNYLRRNRPEIKPSTYVVIEAVFALSHLITGEERDHISRENVHKILDFAVLFNYYAYNHYEHTFGSDLPANLEVHKRHREMVGNAAKEIQSSMQRIFVPDRGGKIHSLDIMTLIKSFLKESDTETLHKIEGVLFAKKVITGGNPKTLTHNELGFLFSHLPKLLTMMLDGVRYEHLNLDQLSLMKFVHEDVLALSNMFFHPSRGDRSEEQLFHVDEAIEGIDRFLEDDKKIVKYRGLIHEAKRILTLKKTDGVKTRGPAASIPDLNWVTGEDVGKILDHIYTITHRGITLHKIFNSPVFADQLSLPQSIYLDPKKYEIEFPQDKAELNMFCRIVNNFRFQRGSFDMSYYSLDYHRNAEAVVEISMFEYIIKEFFRSYGSSLSMSAESLKAILKNFENELIEMDIVMPRRSSNTAETISLLGSLFQYQSDDNKVLDVDEAAEFAISLMTAMDAKKKLFSFYKDRGCALDGFDRIDPTCFKENFYQGICENYRAYFPRLFEYLGAGEGCEQDFNSTHNVEYLETSIQSARFCHIYPDTQEEIEYSESDIMSIVLAMMHIETTIIRWDQNLNNTMDADEVMDAYNIYKPAIEGMLPKLPSWADKPQIKTFLAKQVYLYLVKYENTPQFDNAQNIIKTVKFLLSFNKKAPAHRKTIASILRVVSEQSKKKSIDAGEPQFDCNWLHDPENIPRD